MTSNMKGQNKMKRITAILLTILIIAALSACGSDNGSKDPTENSANGALAEFLESDTGKELVETLVSSAESGGSVSAKCYADGNTLVLDSSFVNDIPEKSIDSVKSSLRESVEEDSFKSKFDKIKPVIKAFIGTDVDIKIIFRTNDSTVLLEEII